MQAPICVGGRCKHTHYFIKNQLDVQGNDDARTHPSQELHLGFNDKFPHFFLVADGMDKRDGGKAQLHAQHDMTQHQHVSSRIFAQKINGQKSGDDGNEPGNQSLQPSWMRRFR
jgi:hypothetical protein